MKNVALFVIVWALTFPFIAASCDTGDGGCTTDDDCSAGEVCTKAAPETGACGDGAVGCTCTGVDSGGDEGGIDDSEGGADCAGDDSALGAGDGLVVDLVTLDTNGTAGSDCAVEGGSPFDLTVSLPSVGQPATWDGTVPNATWITFQSGDNEAAYNESFCNGGAVACADGGGGACDGAADCFCVCGLCLGGTPNDLAVQVRDSAGDTSAGVCVDLSGA